MEVESKVVDAPVAAAEPAAPAEPGKKLKAKRKTAKRKSGVTQEPLCVSLGSFRKFIKEKFPHKAHLKISKDALYLMDRVFQAQMMSLLTKALQLQRHARKETLQTVHIVKAQQLIGQNSYHSVVAGPDTQSSAQFNAPTEIAA